MDTTELSIILFCNIRMIRKRRSISDFADCDKEESNMVLEEEAYLECEKRWVFAVLMFVGGDLRCIHIFHSGRSVL